MAIKGWTPVGVYSLPPWRMAAPGTSAAYFVLGPLLYLLLYGCIADWFPFAAKSIIFAAWVFWHVAGPLCVWVYEVRCNPYTFAPEMRGRATAADEAELRRVNGEFLVWYFDTGNHADFAEFRYSGRARDGQPALIPDLL